MSGWLPLRDVDVGFVRVELDFATTALETARISGNPEQVARCVALAKQARRTVIELLPKIQLSEYDRRQIEERLQVLTAKLAQFSTPSGEF